MSFSAEDPAEVRSAPRWDSSRHGARVWWIRRVAAELLALRCVEDAAEKLKAEESQRPEARESDERAKALIQIIKECLEPERNTEEGEALWIVLDFDGRASGTSAKERRTRAGQEFRGKNGTPVG